MDLRAFRVLENPAALLAIVVTVLLSVGMVMLYSASGARAGYENNLVIAKFNPQPEDTFRNHHGADYFKKQVAFAILGLIAAAAAMRIPLEYYERYALHLLIVSFFVLILVVASPLGVEAKGAKRWLRVGPLTVQPAEFAKVILVIFLAKMMADKREKMKLLFGGVVPSLVVFAIFTILIAAERDFGTIVLTGLVVGGMWCLAQVRFTHLAGLVMLALPFLAALVLQYSYRIERILAFLYPDKYAKTAAFQLNESLIAVGSGGISGTGLGLGMQKYHFLSEAHTDFIFAIVCEELGLIGSISVCLLFVALALVGFRISYKAPDYFSGLLAAGLTMMIVCAAFINFFVVLGLAPTKGLALPFFSAGGSSIIASLIAVAMLINISNHSSDPVGRGTPA